METATHETLAKHNPCLRCGACCASFRVSFYWAEVEASGLTAEWTEKMDFWRSCMAGTNQPRPRCRALHGQVGVEAFCAVYDRRPSPCRAVEPGGERCNKARTAHGLEPLENPPGTT